MLFIGRGRVNGIHESQACFINLNMFCLQKFIDSATGAAEKHVLFGASGCRTLISSAIS